MSVTDDPICPICGLLFASDILADVRHHKKFHDVHVNGPKTKMPEGIHLILPHSPLRDRLVAQEAASLLSRELNFRLPYCATSF